MSKASQEIWLKPGSWTDSNAAGSIIAHGDAGFHTPGMRMRDRYPALPLFREIAEAIDNGKIPFDPMLMGIPGILNRANPGSVVIDPDGHTLHFSNLDEFIFGGRTMQFGDDKTQALKFVTETGSYLFPNTAPPNIAGGGRVVMGWQNGAAIWIEVDPNGAPTIQELDTSKLVSRIGQILPNDGDYLMWDDAQQKWLPHTPTRTLQQLLDDGDTTINGNTHGLEFEDLTGLRLQADGIDIETYQLRLFERGSGDYYKLPLKAPDPTSTQTLMWVNGVEQWADAGGLFQQSIPYMLTLGNAHVDHHGHDLEFMATDQFRVEADSNIYMETKTRMKLFAHGGYQLGQPNSTYSIPNHAPNPNINQILYWRKDPAGQFNHVEWFDPENFGALPIIQKESMIPPPTVNTPDGARYYVLQTDTGQPYNMMFIYDKTNGQYMPVGSRNWIRPDPSTRDVGTAHTGDQRILYNGNKAIQVWEDSVQDFLEIYSENHILELIAQNSLFQGTLRKTAQLGSEAFDAAWLTAHNPSPANKGHYWTFQEVMTIRSTQSTGPPGTTLPPGTVPDPLQPNEIEPLPDLPAINPIVATVTDTSTPTQSQRTITLTEGPAMQDATLDIDLQFSDATLNYAGQITVEQGDDINVAGQKIVTALRQGVGQGVTIASTQPGQIIVSVALPVTITTDTFNLADTGTRPQQTNPFNGKEIKVGDWIQSLGDQTQGMNGWTIISGDLVTKSRGDKLYGMAPWQPGSSYEIGALVAHGGRLWRATKNFNAGEADALAAPGTLGTTQAFPGGIQDLGQVGTEMAIPVDDQDAFNAALPMPNPLNRGWWVGGTVVDITTAVSYPGIPKGTLIPAGSFIWSDGIRWNIVPPGTPNWPPDPTLGVVTDVDMPPIPVLPTAPWAEVELLADMRTTNYQALPPTDNSGQPWVVLGDPRLNGVPSVQRYDQASQSWQIVNSGQLPLDPAATTPINQPGIATVSSTPPADPGLGQLWVNPDDLKLYVWLGEHDANTNTWTGAYVQLN